MPLQASVQNPKLLRLPFLCRVEKAIGVGRLPADLLRLRRSWWRQWVGSFMDDSVNVIARGDAFSAASYPRENVPWSVA